MAGPEPRAPRSRGLPATPLRGALGLQAEPEVPSGGPAPGP